jgi:hypothetical protein
MSAKGKSKAKAFATLPNAVPVSSTKLHEGALDNANYVNA